ncbi:unnamed protein product [Rotaria socialis]|uniref:Uncharacterized protein n=3 Tax=Rotaria socialis TaxID=392032 RepID=A0A818FD77_9BILA|nr:unnamed protein product [Rotaria socialis]
MNKKEMSKKYMSTTSSNKADKSTNADKTKEYPLPLVSASLSSPTIKNTVPQKCCIKYLDPQQNYESVTFIWLDPQSQSKDNIVTTLRMINNYVQSYTDSLSCFTSIESSKDKIFFICTSTNIDVISTANAMPNVEAIFILKLDGLAFKTDFVKVIGIYEEQEELVRALKQTLETCQQIRFEEFLFETENTFLWLQLWRDDIMTRKSNIGKQEFMEVTQNYYQYNNKILALIREFGHSYVVADALSWCLRSPFPSRFISHALYSRNMENLNLCRFLINGATRFLEQQPKHKSSTQFYRGMKLHSEFVTSFAKNIGKLMCTSWFFVCTKSRTVALAAAQSPAYRPDLIPVFFKIDCDSKTAYVELFENVSSPVIVFDICTTFRILYVGQDQMVIVKMKIASDDGRKAACEYKKKYESASIEELLDQVACPSKECIVPEQPLKQPAENREHQPSSPPTSKTIPFSSLTYSDRASGASACEECAPTDLTVTEYERIQRLSSCDNIEIVKNTTNKLNRQGVKKWRDYIRQ